MRNSQLGKKQTEETKLKRSNALKGRKRPIEVIEKIKQSKQNISQESLDKFSKARKGHIVSPETRKKISDKLKGRKLDEEHRLNIINALIGRPVSEETKNKISKANKGRKKNG